MALEPVPVDLKWTWVVPSPGKVEITAVGIPGPPGSGDKNVIYLVSGFSPASVWVITHNMGKFPCVSIQDSSGREVQGDVVHNSMNQLTITFSAPFSGRASLN